MSPRLFLPSLALLSTLLLGCGGSEESTRPPVEGHVGVYSLLALREHMVVTTNPTKMEPDQGHMRPGPSARPLPCFQVRAGTWLQFSLPDVPVGAVLQVDLGLRRNGYRGEEGRVVFQGRLDGKQIFKEEIDCRGDVPNEERLWHRVEVPLKAGRLELGSTYYGDTGNGPVVGFGSLRVALPFTEERQLSGPDAPNVILIVVDTLRADRLSCHGHHRTTSPTLDRLAAEGLFCERAYSSSSWTIPGTASVLTGLSAPAHGLGVAESNYLPDQVETLPRLFATRGFTCAAFATNPLIDGSRNFDQGFEEFSGESWTPTPLMQDKVFDWIDGVGEDRFFLYLHPTDPHSPYQATPEALARQGVETPDDLTGAKLRATANAWYAGDGTKELVERENAYYSDVYDAEVDVIDTFVADVLASLEKAGLADKTIIALTADHGEEFLDHGLVGHFNQLYPESIHVPMIVWGPGVPAGEVLSFPVENRHVAQTLLELADIQPSEPIGVSLIAGKQVLSAEPVFAVAAKGREADFEAGTSRDLGPMVTVIHEGWQLIRISEPGGGVKVELYNVKKDPNCTSDLASERPGRVKTLSKLIDDWFTEESQDRPELVPTSPQTLELMRGIGYLGDEDE